MNGPIQNLMPQQTENHTPRKSDQHHSSIVTNLLDMKLGFLRWKDHT